MRKILLLLTISLFIGCNLNSSQPSKVEVDTNVASIAQSMKDVKKEDCLIMYKQFSGLSEYLKNAGKNVDSTPKVWALISGFQSQYNWKRETYKEYTDSVEKFLLDKEYKKPKKLVSLVSDKNTEIEKSQVIKDMQILADAARLALESKNDK